MWGWFSNKPQVTGGSKIAFNGKSFVSRVCFVFQRGETKYALCSGRCASTDPNTFAGNAEAYLVYDSGNAVLIGNTETGVWDIEEWGMDFAVVRLMGYVDAKVRMVGDQPIVNVLGTQQIKDFLGCGNTLAVAGVNDFELVDMKNTGPRKGFRLILRRKGLQSVPVTGDPVTFVVGKEHILVGMIVAHVTGCQGAYIAGPMDWFLNFG